MSENRPNSCQTCVKELVSIAIVVDGRDLVMHSCQTCDTRTWSLAGQSIELATALAQVGEHSGRRR